MRGKLVDTRPAADRTPGRRDGVRDAATGAVIGRPLRVVLCDDHRLFVEPIAAALVREGHRAVVTTTPPAACEAIAVHRPDVVVTDLQFPGFDGSEVVVQLCDRYPILPVVVLTGSTDERHPAAIRTAGAVGYLRKDMPIRAVLSAIEQFARGGAVTEPACLVPFPLSAQARTHHLVSDLTGREREVLTWLMAAQDTAGIARALGVAPSTARTHLQNVLVKLGVHTRLQAVALMSAGGGDM